MKSTVSFLLSVLVMACSQNYSVIPPKAAAKTSVDPSSGAAASAQKQGFINVEGQGLKARMAEATRQARSKSRTEPFWAAYSFDVRPGVAVDLNINQFSGTIGDYGGTSVLIGTSNGVRVETRNLAVFLLMEPGGGRLTRMEIYNLEREREYSGYQVYWLGRAGNEESLEYLRALAVSNADSKLTERATLAIGLHDDRRVGTMLKDLIGNSADVKVRSSAIYWLGYVGGEQEFLVSLVRDEREIIKVRERAAYAIGRSGETASLPLLENLYNSVTHREVKQAIISAASRNENKPGAISFLSKIAKSDPELGSRKSAIHRLGRLPGTTPLLADMVRNERETPEIRSLAVSALRRSSDEGRVTTLEGLYRAVSDRKIRRDIISAVSRTEKSDSEAADFLLKVIRGDADPELRREAVSRLGRMGCPRCIQSLADIVKSNSSDARVQIEAVRSLSRASTDDVIPLLIDIARTHPSAEVRKEVIRRLRSKKDERVQEFLKEVITK
ncbi:MAG: HEAT repeat domain-containing protein [Blastocatellia bacterium]|nr:HEAT repeat domain-containing protein [Blastocatellia bacterium]